MTTLTLKISVFGSTNRIVISYETTYYYCLIFRFLNKHPEYIKMFPFRNLPRERFAEDKKFQAHCANIIYTLSAIVESLNDTDLLVQMLLKSGESHGRRKVPAKAYWVRVLLHHIGLISKAMQILCKSVV